MGNAVAAAPDYHWAIFHGVDKRNSQKRVVFKFEKANVARERLEAAQNAFARMRTLVHPSLLRSLESLELEKELLLVTEDVKPLRAWLPELADSPVERAADQLLWGLELTLKALVFLNETNQLVHGCLCLDAIFVTPAGDWRLGALDLVGSCEAVAPGQQPPLYCRLATGLMPSQAPPPEMRPGAALRSLQLAPWALDIYGLGRILEEIRDQLPRVHAQLMKVCGTSLNAFTANGPAERPAPSAALRGLAAKALKRPMVSILRNLDNLASKAMPDRIKFLETIGKHLKRLPTAVKHDKVLPCCVEILETSVSEHAMRLMGSQDVIRGAINALLPFALSIFEDKSNTIEAAEAKGEFKARLLPILSSIVAQQDRSLRLCLLSLVGTFLPFADDDAVNRVFFEPILQGFADSGSARLREATLKTLVHFLGRLTERNLNDRLPAQLLRLQNDPEPGIRTNIAIFIGRMAPKLKPGVRARMLLSALPRGLKDSFFHARIASMRALLACQEFVEPAGLATKVLPLICPLLVDPVEDVRDFAFQCLDSVRSRLEAHSRALAEEQAKGEAQKAEAAAGGDTGWGVRAISSLAAADGPKEASSEGKIVAPAAAVQVQDDWDALDQSLDTDIDIPTVPANGAPPEQPVNGSGWGDDEDWGLDDDEDDADGSEVAAPAPRPQEARKPKVVLSAKSDAQKAEERRRKQEEIRRKREERKRLREATKMTQATPTRSQSSGNKLGLPTASSSSSLGASSANGENGPVGAAPAARAVSDTPTASPARTATSRRLQAPESKSSPRRTANSAISRAAKLKPKPVKLQVENKDDDEEEWDW